MLKLTVSMDGVVVMEQEERDEVILSFLNEPARAKKVVEKQGWYALVSETQGITYLYKITPVYSKKVLHE